jgi:hypothetical protein
MLDSKLPNPDSGTVGRPEGSLPLLRSSGGCEDGEQTPTAAPSKAKAQGLASDPVARVLTSMQFGEAPCVGFLGDRGWGKSTAMKAVVRGWLARNPGVALVCDKSGSSGFEGQRRISESDLRLRPMSPEPRVVVFTGDLCDGTDPDVEGIARFAWRLRSARCGSLVVCDEMKWVARGMQWKNRARWLPQTCTEGRKHDVGFLWAAQIPQDVPMEAYEESSFLVVGHLAGLGVRCLRDRDYLLGLPDGALESLPDDQTPPKERGRCVILRRGKPWDGKFYRFA